MNEFSSTPLDVLSEKEQRLICESILDKELESAEEAKSDYKGMILSSVGCFLITILTTIPIILPVLLISDFMLALTVASTLSTVILFFVGFYIAPYLGLNRWTTSITITMISVGISVIALYTGG